MEKLRNLAATNEKNLLKNFLIKASKQVVLVSLTIVLNKKYFLMNQLQ
jgi:vacuolar-type H+-ATPase subunit E/Vma4